LVNTQKVKSPAISKITGLFYILSVSVQHIATNYKQELRISI